MSTTFSRLFKERRGKWVHHSGKCPFFNVMRMDASRRIKDRLSGFLHIEPRVVCRRRNAHELSTNDCASGCHNYLLHFSDLVTGNENQTFRPASGGRKDCYRGESRSYHPRLFQRKKAWANLLRS